MKILRLLAPAVLAFLPSAVHAQLISGAVDIVSGGQLSPTLATGIGFYLANDFAARFVVTLSTLVGIAATFVIVRSGIKLINSQDDDKLSRARRSIAAAVVAIILAALTPMLIRALYGTGDTVGTEGGTIIEGDVAGGASILAEELFGIMRWVTVLVVPLSIAVVVVSALQAVASFGGDDAPGKVRKAMLGAITGILMLTCSEAIKATFGLYDGFPPGIPSTAPLLIRAAGILNSLLLFLGLGAAAMVVYAGFLMILNIGNEDQYSKAKSLLIRVVVGLIVVVISYLSVSFIIGLVVG